MRFHTLVRLTLLALALTLPAAGRSAEAQSLRVVAMDSAANRPLRNAMVVLLDHAGDVAGVRRTDRGGVTRFGPLDPGYYALQVSAGGFHDRITSWIVVSATDTLEATVRLARAAQLLEAVVVSSSRDSASQYLPAGVTTAMGATVMPPGLIDRHAPGSGDYVTLLSQLGVRGMTVRYWRESERDPAEQLHSCVRSTRSSQSCLLLFVNDARIVDFEAAKYMIPPEQVGWAVFVPPIHAGVLYGDGADHGALLIYTKDRLARLGSARPR